MDVGDPGGAMEEGGGLQLPDWSPQGVDVLLLSVLRGVGIPAGALIPYVAGHRERDHLVGWTHKQTGHPYEHTVTLPLTAGQTAQQDSVLKGAAREHQELQNQLDH